MEVEDVSSQENQGQKTKKSRHRKKQLYNAIKSQLGSSNKNLFKSHQLIAISPQNSTSATRI
jgi:hypothetical protein